RSTSGQRDATTAGLTLDFTLASGGRQPAGAYETSDPRGADASRSPALLAPLPALAVFNASILLQGQTRQGEDSLRSAREQLVRESLERAEPPIKNPRVLEAMRSTPRHQFVSSQYRKFAYIDTVLPIGYQQTISPPYIVAYMTEKIDPQPSDR